MPSSTNVLAVKARAEKGKGPARRLRAAGLIPAVVYGQKLEPTHIAVDPAAIEKAIATPHKLNTLLTLQLDGRREAGAVPRVRGGSGHAPAAPRRLPRGRDGQAGPGRGARS